MDEPLQSKCSRNFIKISETTIWIVAAYTRTACMFLCLGNQSPIFPHLPQKYFSISCRNISPSLAEVFLSLFQKYFSTSCLDFHHRHPLALPLPISPPQLGAFGDTHWPNIDLWMKNKLWHLCCTNDRYIWIFVSPISLQVQLLLCVYTYSGQTPGGCCPRVCFSKH